MRAHKITAFGNVQEHQNEASQFSALCPAQTSLFLKANLHPL